MLDWMMTAAGMEATDAAGYVYEARRLTGTEGHKLTVTGPGHYWEDLGHFLTLAEAMTAAESTAKEA